MILERPWSGKTYSAHGRSFIHTNCPFCAAAMTVYVWSLNGCGKKLCKCGAALYRDGIARKLEPQSAL